MILKSLIWSFSPVWSALITCKEEAKLDEILAAVKEHKAHMVMMSCLPKGTSGRKEISDKNIYFARKQQKQRGVRSASKRTEIDCGNSQEQDSVCFHCEHAGYIAAKRIANMPQEIKDSIMSGAAHIAREAESDESTDEDDTAEISSFSKEKPHIFALFVRSCPNCNLWYPISILSTLLWCAMPALRHLIITSPHSTINPSITSTLLNPLQSPSPHCWYHWVYYSYTSVILIFILVPFVSCYPCLEYAQTIPWYKVCSCMSYLHNSKIDLACSAWTHALKSPIYSVYLCSTLNTGPYLLWAQHQSWSQKSIWTPATAKQHHPIPTIANKYQPTLVITNITNPTSAYIQAWP